MKKKFEATNPNSCWNKAHDDEMVFVLFGRDKSAPVAIRVWAADRVICGKNKTDDAEIVDALRVASIMEEHFHA